MDAVVDLTLGESVDLAHALVSALSASIGVRALFIKGPTLAILGLRSPRVSSDVDVFVEPHGRSRLVEELSSAGWRQRPTVADASVLPDHAVHMINDSWPCDIDIHDSYPGLYAEKQDVFECLWDQRLHVAIAGWDVCCPGPVASALILAAHSLRDPARSRSADELEFLAARVRTAFSPEDVAKLVSTARALRALETLAPFLAMIGVSTGEFDLTPRERNEWALRISDDSRAMGIARSVWKAKLQDKPRLAYRALIPPKAQMLAEHPEAASGPAALRRARIARIRRGVAHFFSALKEYWRNRRRMTRGRRS